MKFKEQGKRCPECLVPEFRPVLIGNDKNGWDYANEWKCDNCGNVEADVHDCHTSEEDGCEVCNDINEYQEYKNSEIDQLNANRN